MPDLPDQTPSPPEVTMGRDRPWLSLLVAFIGFWILFGVNAFLVGIFTESSVGVIAALAAVGQIIISLSLPITEILAALASKAGIRRRISN